MKMAFVAFVRTWINPKEMLCVCMCVWWGGAGWIWSPGGWKLRWGPLPTGSGCRFLLGCCQWPSSWWERTKREREKAPKIPNQLSVIPKQVTWLAPGGPRTCPAHGAPAPQDSLITQLLSTWQPSAESGKKGTWPSLGGQVGELQPSPVAWLVLLALPTIT